MKIRVALLFAVLLPAPFVFQTFGTEDTKNESPSRQAAGYQDEDSPLDTAAKRRGIQPFLLRSDKSEELSSNLLLARKNKIEILNSGTVFEQGETVVIGINDKTAIGKTGISVFGKSYRFNGAGLSFIGIDAIQKPGKYQLVPVDLENPNQFWLNEMFKSCSNCLTIEVVSRKYQEARFKKFTPDKQQQKQRTREAEMMQAAYNSVDRTQNYIIGKYISPLSGKNIGELEITDPFRIWRRYSTAKNDRDWHRGVDLRAAGGTPVAAINSGIVVLAVKDFLLEGNMVILYHGLGIFSLYIHLSEIKVSVGQKLNAGEIIGFSGRGGAKSTGPHLHLGLKINGATVDPLKFIEIANRHL